MQRQLEIANANHVFDSEAIEHIYDLTGGIPRLVNQVCDHAFVLSAAGGRAKIDKQTIREAWSDLQQLPLPVDGEQSTSSSCATNSIVEFGTLEDLSEPPAAGGAEVPQDAAVLNVDPSTCGSVNESLTGDGGPEHQLDVVEQTVQCIAEEFPSEGDEAPDPVFLEQAEFLDGALDEPACDEFIVVEPYQEDLPRGGNPFLETFDEEEIVLDRFSISNTDFVDSLPSVATQDGLTLVEMLQLIEALEEAGLNPSSEASEEVSAPVAEATDETEPVQASGDAPTNVTNYYGTIETRQQWTEAEVLTSELYAETEFESAASQARCVVAPSVPRTASSDFASADEAIIPPATDPDWQPPLSAVPSAPKKRQFARLFSQLAGRTTSQPVSFKG